MLQHAVNPALSHDSGCVKIGSSRNKRHCALQQGQHFGTHTHTQSLDPIDCKPVYSNQIPVPKVTPISTQAAEESSTMITSKSLEMIV